MRKTNYSVNITPYNTFYDCGRMNGLTLPLMTEVINLITYWLIRLTIIFNIVKKYFKDTATLKQSNHQVNNTVMGFNTHFPEYEMSLKAKIIQF